jgi:carbonic anhydrase
VCGHTDCGVIRGALHPERLTGHASVASWLRYAQIYDRAEEPSDEIMLTLAQRNVVTQLRNLRTHPAVAQRLIDGDLALHGWFYDIGQGKVSVYDEVHDTFTGT